MQTLHQVSECAWLDTRTTCRVVLRPKRFNALWDTTPTVWVHMLGHTYHVPYCPQTETFRCFMRHYTKSMGPYLGSHEIIIIIIIILLYVDNSLYTHAKSLATRAVLNVQKLFGSLCRHTNSLRAHAKSHKTGVVSFFPSFFLSFFLSSFFLCFFPFLYSNQGKS